MIALTTNPLFDKKTAEGIKLFEIYECYSDIALFWNQENTDISVSLLDGNMIISGKNADFEELKGFIKMISPSSIFTNETVLKGLELFDDSQIVSVLSKKSDFLSENESDRLSSDDVYGILKKSGLEMPDFNNFVTDYCLRLNKGRLKYYAFKGKAVALSIGTDDILIHALASNQKGLGTLCLNGLLGLFFGKTVLVCATKEVEKFYIKNGFNKIYLAGYWRKK